MQKQWKHKVLFNKIKADLKKKQDKLWQQDYLSIIVGALSISCILILVVSAVYYILSFMKNKGVYLGTYIMVSNMALFPFLFTVAVLYPVGIIISYYIGFLLVLSVFDNSFAI